MTFEELKDLRYLAKEKRFYNEKIKELKARPHETELNKQSIELYQSIVDKCAAQLLEGERFITGIESAYFRQLFTLRFINGETWTKIALRMGGGNTADSVRRACSRYIEAHDKE